jgi:Integrase zinc binding domain
MILCDRCNECYHKDCARSSGGSKVHDGPWFCVLCRGHLTLHGADDITQDWPLMDHLWTGWLPGDPDEADRITSIARQFRANGNELQVRLSATQTEEERWVDVPPLITRNRLMMDTHDSLGHCGRDKLFAALQFYFWWPRMYSDVIDCIRQCAVCQKDRPPKTPPEVLRWIDKG